MFLSDVVPMRSLYTRYYIYQMPIFIANTLPDGIWSHVANIENDIHDSLCQKIKNDRLEIINTRI